MFASPLRTDTRARTRQNYRRVECSPRLHNGQCPCLIYFSGLLGVLWRPVPSPWSPIHSNFAKAVTSGNRVKSGMPAPQLSTRLDKSGPALRTHQFIRKRSARTMRGQVPKVRGYTESRSGRCRSRGDRGRSCSQMSAMASPAEGPH